MWQHGMADAALALGVAVQVGRVTVGCEIYIYDIAWSVCKTV